MGRGTTSEFDSERKRRHLCFTVPSADQQHGRDLSPSVLCVRSASRPYASSRFLFLKLRQLFSSSLCSVSVTAPTPLSVYNADRIETPEMSDLDTAPHLGQRVSGALIPFDDRMWSLFSVMRRQKSASSSHEIEAAHVRSSSSSISGNQTRCASPEAIVSAVFYRKSCHSQSADFEHLDLHPHDPNPPFPIALRSGPNCDSDS